MDEFQVAAREVLGCSIKDQRKMCGHFGCRKAAARLRLVAANALRQANDVYHHHGVAHGHLASIEVSNRARALVRQAARGE
jgi:hypothetical protein